MLRIWFCDCNAFMSKPERFRFDITFRRFPYSFQFQIFVLQRQDASKRDFHLSVEIRISSLTFIGRLPFRSDVCEGRSRSSVAPYSSVYSYCCTFVTFVYNGVFINRKSSYGKFIFLERGFKSEGNVILYLQSLTACTAIFG